MDRSKEILKLLIRIQKAFPFQANIYIPTKLSKRIYSLYYILDDINMARLTTVKLLKMIDQAEIDNDMSDRHVYDVIWYGIVVAYARCFTKNEGNFRKLEDSVFANDVNAAEIHEKIMTLRNSFIAHRGDTFMIEAAIALIIPDHDPSQNRFVAEIQRRAFDLVDLHQYIKLFDFLEKQVFVLLEKERKRLQQKLNEIGPVTMVEHNLMKTIIELNKEIQNN